MIDKPPSLIRARNDDAGQAYHIYYVFSRITAADLLISYFHKIKKMVMISRNILPAH